MRSRWLPQGHDGCPLVNSCTLLRLALGRLQFLFTRSRSFEGWWEGTKATYLPDFVEWVEEQRSKAA